MGLLKTPKSKPTNKSAVQVVGSRGGDWIGPAQRDAGDVREELLEPSGMSALIDVGFNDVSALLEHGSCGSAGLTDLPHSSVSFD